MNPYLSYVQAFLALQKMAAALPLGGFEPVVAAPSLPDDAPVAMAFSPHPDDNEINAPLLALLRRQLGMRIASVAVTLGSNKARRPGRLAELKGASVFLGYELVEVCEGGFERINPAGITAAPQNWASAVQRVGQLITQYRPGVLVCPHALDANTTHVGTNRLMFDALEALGSYPCKIVQWEFWGQNREPNLLVEVTRETAADAVGAVSFHVGEVERNPYHLTLVPWLTDNVRRAEVVLGQGKEAPPWEMAVPLRIDRWDGNNLAPLFEGGRLIAAGDAAALKEVFG